MGVNLVRKLEGLDPGFENWESRVLKLQQTEARNTGNTWDFYLLYTNISISEKSPLWKVFSSHIPVLYGIYFMETPRPIHPKIWGSETPGLTPMHPRELEALCVDS